MSKQLYFVRHGQSVSNENDTVQGFDDPLSSRGIEQAEFLADRLARIPFEKLLVSDMARTHQTAAIVSAKTGHEPEFSPLFREITYPSRFYALPRTDPQILEYWNTQSEMRQTDLHWKLAEEESLMEIMERVNKGFEYAASQKEDTVVIITHGHFLRMLLLLKLTGDNAPKYWKETDPFLSHSNTGITVFNRKSEHDMWRLITWNDHAHLG